MARTIRWTSSTGGKPHQTRGASGFEQEAPDRVEGNRRPVLAGLVAAVPLPAAGASRPVEAVPLVRPLQARRPVGSEVGVDHRQEEGPIGQRPGDAHAVLDGLAAGAQEDAAAVLEPQQGQDLARGLVHDRTRVAVPRVGDPPRLLGQDAEHSRIPVSDRRAPDSRLQVDVAPSFCVIETTVLGPDDLREEQLVARIPDETPLSLLHDGNPALSARRHRGGCRRRSSTGPPQDVDAGSAALSVAEAATAGAPRNSRRSSRIALL